jgi:hypothetical protein
LSKSKGQDGDLVSQTEMGRVIPAIQEGQSGRGLHTRSPIVSWLQIAFSFPVMITFLLVTVVFIMARGGIGDPDIWWHLRNAEYFFQTHSLPRQDMYSFTVTGHPWINHEWLAEIPYYVAWRAWGLMGMKNLLIILLEVIFLGVLYLSWKESRNFKASILASCVSVFLATVSFGPRTILFGYAYLVVLLIILQRFRQRGRAPVWLIPPLFCLWVNTHGSWLLGLIVFCIIVAGGVWKGSLGLIVAEPWSPAQLRKLVFTGLASVAALFVNPFGYRLVLYPFDIAFRQKLNIAHIAEWVSVNFHDTRGKVVLAVLATLFLGSLLRRSRWTLTELGLVLFALYCGLTHVRFLFLAGIIVAPVIAKILNFVPPYQREIDRYALNALMIALMVLGMWQYWPTSAGLAQGVDREYPAGALVHLKTHPPPGPMLNFYIWGGYLGWHDRDLKVFIDSRVDIFEHAGVFRDYLDLLELKHPEAILDKYRIRSVLFPPGEPLTYALEHDEGWKVVYRDSVSILFEKVGEVPSR